MPCVIYFDTWNVKAMPFIVMESLTTQQRILVVQNYYENGRSVKINF